MASNRLAQILIMLFIINCLIISLSNSTSIQLPRDGTLERVSNSNDQYNKDGWTTYTLESSSIARITVSEGGSFIYAWKLDRQTPNKLYFNNQLLDSVLDFKESNYIELTEGDTLKWVFSINDRNGGKAWIAFPNEYLSLSESTEFVKPINKLPGLNNLAPDVSSPQEVGCSINWTATAIDDDSDDLFYRFLINDMSKTSWRKENTWMWNTTGYEGKCKIEAQVRDGNHSKPENFDDNISTIFFIKKDRHDIYNLTIKADKSSPQVEGSTITFKILSNNLDLNDSLCRFFVRGRAATDWGTSPSLVWITNNSDIGTNKIEVQVKNMNSPNENKYIYSANMSYDIGLLIKDNEDIPTAIKFAESNNIIYIFIKGLHKISKPLEINNFPIKMIGLSKDSRITPADSNVECATYLNADNCSIMNISLEGFSESIIIHADNCTIENTNIFSDETAIKAEKSNNTTIINNIFHGDTNNEGVLLFIDSSAFIKIMNNTLDNSTNPIILASVGNSYLERNEIIYSNIGVEMIGCNGVDILNNSIKLSQKYGNFAYSFRICKNCENIRVVNNTIGGKACDDNSNSTNKWEKNCWKDLPCSEGQDKIIQRCKLYGKGSLDKNPKCCNGD